MNVKQKKEINIDWDIDLCKSEASVVNGVLQNASIVMQSNNANTFKCSDEQFLRDTHKALGELILLLDKERGIVKEEANFTENIMDRIFANGEGELT